MLYVTGDTHGEEEIFTGEDSIIDRTLGIDDTLFICGDFGFLFQDTHREQEFLTYLAEEKPYKILFIDGNHENFDMINQFPVEEWQGGKVHVIRRDREGNPKIIHLMRGQVFEVEGKRIFTFGGGHSTDKVFRKEGDSWWPEEMPNISEYQEGHDNLENCGFKVDYILTHTAPEDTIKRMGAADPAEEPLNNQLEWFRELTAYQFWWFGHHHLDQEMFRNQTAVFRELRNMETNEIITGSCPKNTRRLILTSSGLNVRQGVELIKKVFAEEGLRPGRIFLLTIPSYGVDERVKQACLEIGFTEENIFMAGDYADYSGKELPEADYIYVTEGNTFEIMDWARRFLFDEYIREQVSDGAVYIGASAGAILASGYDFMQARHFDSNYVNMMDYRALGLMPETDTCIPHHDPEQFLRYQEEIPDTELSRYSHIYPISEDEALIMICSGQGQDTEAQRIKRVRVGDARKAE